MTAAEKLAEPLPLSIPTVAYQSYFACACLNEHCTRAGFQADALPHIVAAELRGMAGELMARHDVDRRQSGYSAALVLLARAEALEEL